MKQDTHITEVQFRIDKVEVFAVFPYEISNLSNVTCYSHIGQHSTCIWNINNYSKSASIEQYSDLKKELENLGYNLKVIKRRSHKKYLKNYYIRNKYINQLD